MNIAADVVPRLANSCHDFCFGASFLPRPETRGPGADFYKFVTNKRLIVFDSSSLIVLFIAYEMYILEICKYIFFLGTRFCSRRLRRDRSVAGRCESPPARRPPEMGK